MIGENERYDELKNLGMCIEDFKITVGEYADLDCFIEQDRVFINKILEDADAALNTLISVLYKDVMKCPCGCMPKLNAHVMKLDCPGCGMSSPRKASRAEAVEAWNRIVKGLEDGEE